MRIGIEINGVLRNTLGKIEQTYQKFLIDKTDGIENEESFEYKMTYPINSLLWKFLVMHSLQNIILLLI